MEVLEFMKQKNRMCDYYSGRTCAHDDSGETCPAMSIDCEITSDKLEQLVAIVEKWAKEHPEVTSAATNPKNNEPCVKTIRDDLAGDRELDTGTGLRAENGNGAGSGGKADAEVMEAYNEYKAKRMGRKD